MRVELLASTPNPEQVITLAASTCYSSDNYDDMLVSSKSTKKQESLIKSLIKSGHESPLEHASFTFWIEDISRATSHQLVRHRVASFSQRSQRYTSQFGNEFLVPESILVNPDMKREFNTQIDDLWNLYTKMLNNGIPKEDARAILPNAATTSLVMTMNLRELRHFFELRTCYRAQNEIRELALRMYGMIYDEHPILLFNSGPKCFTGHCEEKTKTEHCPIKDLFSYSVKGSCLTF